LHNVTIVVLFFSCALALLLGSLNQNAFGTVFDCISNPIDGTQEVPLTGALGTGFAIMVYDDVTNQFVWNIVYSGLTGPPTFAHFHHGSLGVNGPVKVNIPVSTSPMMGNAILIPPDESLLLAGDIYINIHTVSFPPGEIRGQVSCLPRMPGSPGGGGGGLIPPGGIMPVGGEMFPVDTTALLLAATYSTASWMIPILIAAVGFGIIITHQKSKLKYNSCPSCKLETEDFFELGDKVVSKCENPKCRVNLFFVRRYRNSFN